MKKTKSLAVLMTFAIILVGVTSCSEEQGLKNEEVFTSVVIPDSYKNSSPNGRASSATEEIIRDITVTTTSGEVVHGKVKLTIPTEGDGLVGFEITQNIFDQTELTPTFWTDGVSKQSNAGGRIAGIGECLSGCQDIPKGEGRGWCKAGCWVELAATVAIVIIAVA
jgi:hypothetical protein